MRYFARTVLSSIGMTILFCADGPAATLDGIGLTALRSVATNVDGKGIRVAQPEAQVTTNPPSWEVNPNGFPQLAGRFTFASDLGSTNVFPNALGAASWHASDVGTLFYGQSGGVATNVARVAGYDAEFFVTNYVFNLMPAPDAAVVNQSFTFGNVVTNLPTPTNRLSVADQQAIDSAYDDYAAAFNTLFVSAVNNGGSVSPPGTDYNCLSVGAYGGGSSIGPTLDNGRCKPDITAPGGATSFSTPLVAGAATVLMQAALRGDGGSDTNAAFDMRTIKALLLNGAVKPANWTNSSASPLDARYGAGVVNVLNSYEQLAGGKHDFSRSISVAIGAAHPPLTDTNLVAAGSGWDSQSVTSSAIEDSVNHYLFDVSNGVVTATLVWNRQYGQTNINDLDLFLFNVADSNLVACSTSWVDNVEHFFVSQLPAGCYDLQVMKHGGPGVVSDAETYALAWAFVSPALNLTKSGTNAVLAWPVYPAGFGVEAATNLSAPAWNTNNLPVAVLTNSMNTLPVAATNAMQFFRLRQPNF